MTYRSKQTNYHNGRNYAEDGIQKLIVGWLRYNGYLFTSIPAGLFVSAKQQMLATKLGYTAGAPDLIVWIPGGTLSIECKRPEKRVLNMKTGNMVIEQAAGRQSAEQKAFQERVTSTPGHYYLVAKDLQDVIRFFEYV